VGPVRLAGLPDPDAFEAAFREALAQRLAGSPLAAAGGRLRLAPLRVAVPAGTSAAEAGRSAAAAVHQATLAGLGREPDPCR
jgi:hypothetical protein